MRRRPRGVLALIAAVVAFASATAGLSGTAGAKLASGDPIKLGNLDPFPKSFSAGVTTPPQAIAAYIDDWNKRGGLNGLPVDYVHEYPTGIDPGAYIAALTKLVNDDKVIALTGIGNCQYTINTMRQYRIPSWGATPEPPCGLQDDFMFVGAGVMTAPALTPFKFAVDHGATAFAIVRPAGIAVEGFLNGPIERYLKRHPGVKTKLVDIPIPFAPTAADLDAAILTMKEQGVDAVVIYVTDTTLAINEADIQGVGPKDGVKWFFGPNNYTPQTAKVPELDGIYVSSQAYPWEDTKNPEVKKMIKVLKGKVDVRDGFAQIGYQDAGFLENSLKGIKGKITSTSILTQWKKDKKVRWPLSPMAFDVTDATRNPTGGVILQVKNGAWAPVSDFIVIPAKEFAA
jgi:ABC-type branched-subunit amino acid transport system substrate-binding protein